MGRAGLDIKQLSQRVGLQSRRITGKVEANSQMVPKKPAQMTIMLFCNLWPKLRPPEYDHEYIHGSVSVAEMKNSIPVDRSNIPDVIKTDLAANEIFLKERWTVDTPHKMIRRGNLVYRNDKAIEVATITRKIELAMKQEVRGKRRRAAETTFYDLTERAARDVSDLLKHCKEIGGENCSECENLFQRRPCEGVQNSSATGTHNIE